MATYCTVYNKRTQGMPIVMVNKEGLAVNIANCYFDHPNETMGILERGIGKGCSLRVLV